ncbi:hypothetical protein AKJ16_DCAP11319 [Drosera capensis]
MGKKGRIAEYRERLDQTLMCNDLMNKETLASLAKDQVLHSHDNENHGHVANTSLLERIEELSNLLDMLRSVLDDYVTLPNNCAHPSWKVYVSPGKALYIKIGKSLIMVSDAENIISQANGYTHEQVVGAGQRVRVGLAGGFAFQKVTEDRSYFRVYFLSRILLARPDLIDLSYK